MRTNEIDRTAVKAQKVTIQFGYVYAKLANGETVEAGTDRSFGIRNFTGVRYRCECGAHFDLPRDIARHLTTGTCLAL